MLIRILFISLFSLCSYQVHAATIDHDSGTLTLTLTLKKTPKRIVALAFSFVDALAISGVSPVGIADDGNKNRVIQPVRELIGDWKSVGSRYQPSLEAIAALKPDLIIADSGRHQSIYKDLSQIAPTLMLKSRGVSYQENLLAVQKIAKTVNKVDIVNVRLAKHKQLMSAIKKQLNNNETYQFAIISDKGMWAHSPQSYAGSVIKELGLKSPLENKANGAYLQTSFEQLLNMNPDWLYVGKYTDITVLDKWQKNPLWKLLTIAKPNHLISTSANIWSLSSGVISAEEIAKELLKNNKK